jgi:hypothetical protein
MSIDKSFVFSDINKSAYVEKLRDAQRAERLQIRNASIINSANISAVSSQLSNINPCNIFPARDNPPKSPVGSGRHLQSQSPITPMSIRSRASGSEEDLFNYTKTINENLHLNLQTQNNGTVDKNHTYFNQFQPKLATSSNETSAKPNFQETKFEELGNHPKPGHLEQS